MSIRKILGVLMLCVVFCATEYKKESLEQMRAIVSGKNY